MPQLIGVVENLDDVEESHREFYKKVTVKGVDGKSKEQYQLDATNIDQFAEFAPVKNAHERQKAENATLKEEIATLKAGHVEVAEGYSAEEWSRLKAVDAEVKKGEDPDKKRAHEAEVQSIKNMHEQAIQRVKTKADADLKVKDDKISNLESALRTRVVHDDLTKALIESGVDKKYLKGARALLTQSIKVKGEGGDMSAYVETDLGETAIGEFVPQWAQSEEGKLYVTKASGSDASGNDGKGGSKGGGLEANPWSKGSWNTTVQGQVWKQDSAKADRLAKIAGHKAALGARMDDAK